MSILLLCLTTLICQPIEHESLSPNQAMTAFVNVTDNIANINKAIPPGRYKYLRLDKPQGWVYEVVPVDEFDNPIGPSVLYPAGTIKVIGSVEDIQ